MDWKELKTEEDIAEIQSIFRNFSDAEIVGFNFESGNYIDEELIGHEYMLNKLNVVFQRMDRNPFSIEIQFEGMRRINFYSPLIDECSASITYAKFVKSEKYIYWTKWKEFAPQKREHLEADVTFIEAKSAKWRIIQL